MPVRTGAEYARSRSIAGWRSGSSIESQDRLKFSALTGVRSMKSSLTPADDPAEC